MISCLVWAIGVAVFWMALLAWHVWDGVPTALANGLSYAGLGVLAMGVVSRCVVAWHPALKRVSVLLTCSMLAGIDVGVSGVRGEAGQQMFFAALLGIALVVFAARNAPAGIRRRWLGEKGD